MQNVKSTRKSSPPLPVRTDVEACLVAHKPVGLPDFMLTEVANIASGDQQTGSTGRKDAEGGGGVHFSMVISHSTLSHQCKM